MPIQGESSGVLDLTASGASASPWSLQLKRAVDLILTLPACIVLAPLFALIALAVKLDSPGPVFFRQQRRGQHMNPFMIVKFRSLSHQSKDPNDQYEMVESDPRITRVGRLIRRTSLDELPQLLNVVGGSMSLVGPRPLIEWESRATLKRHGERFLVKPGLTGLSQITVRNSIDLDGRSDIDVDYVRRWSLWLDLKVLARTPFHVIWTKAVYPDD